MNPTNRDTDVPISAWRSDTARHRTPRPSTSAAAWPVRVARVLGRDPGRAVLMMRMASTYVAVSVLARLTSLTRAFAAVSPARRDVAPDERRVERAVDALNTLLAAGMPGIHPQCWRRAAVLHRFLRFEGVDTAIIFGVAPQTSAAVEAHAWLERDGLPFAEAENVTSYRRLFEFPAREKGDG
jgi:hypothetical protein